LFPLSVAIPALSVVATKPVVIEVVLGGVHEHQSTGALDTRHDRSDDSSGKVECAHKRAAIGRGVRHPRGESLLLQGVYGVKGFVREQNVPLGRSSKRRVVDLDGNGTR